MEKIIIFVILAVLLGGSCLCVYYADCSTKQVVLMVIAFNLATLFFRFIGEVLRELFF